MADLLDGAKRWVRAHLLGDHEAAPLPGVQEALHPLDVARAVEERVVEALLDASSMEGGAARALRRAEGAALGGQRAAALLDAGAGAATTQHALRGAIARHLPVVVHRSVDRNEDDEMAGGLAHAGALPFVVPASPQRAADLCLVAHRVAETAMSPVLVAVDAVTDDTAEGALLWLPDAVLVQAYLGQPADEVPCPTPSQALLFGATRRRIVDWLDPSRPVALGARRSAEGRDAATAARQRFFEAHHAEIVARSTDALSALTGRTLEPVLAHGVERADVLVVTAGAGTHVARAVADELRRSHGGNVGVVTVEWLSPFPDDAIRAALGQVRRVVVLERAARPGAGAPLFDAVRRALGDDARPLVGAGFGPGRESPRAEDVRALLVAVAAGDAPSSARLGIAPVAGHSEHPDRQAWIEQVRRAYPSPTTSWVEVDSGTEGGPQGADRATPHVPETLRRRGSAGRGYDALSRYWGEVAGPRRSGELSPRVADPHAAIDVLPAAAATLDARPPRRAQLPTIDVAACVGCGRCWSACPDGALAAAALPTATVLAASLDAAVPPDARRAAPALSKLGRSLKSVAAFVDTRLAETEARGLTRGLVDAAGDWYVEQARPSVEERAALRSALGACLDGALELPAAATETLFHRPGRDGAKTVASLLLLAVDAGSCQGCGICAERCPEGAIVMEPESALAAARLTRDHAALRALPPTPETLIDALEAHDDGDLVGAPFLGRRWAEAMAPSALAEPGSAAKLALRWLLGLAARRAARGAADLARRQRAARDALVEALQRQLAAAMPLDDLASFETATRAAGRRPGNLVDLLEHLEQEGQHPGLDAELAASRAGAARRLEDALAAPGTTLVHGLVLGGHSLTGWAGLDPDNPFLAPTVLTSADAAIDVAEGVAAGWYARSLAMMRLLREGDVLTAGSPDWRDRLGALDALDLGELTPEERRFLPPLIIAVDGGVTTGEGLASLARAVTGDQPLRIVVLDDRTPDPHHLDVTVLARALGSGFVSSASLSSPTELARDWTEALEQPGPAVVRIGCPSPSAHGFAPAETLAHAEAWSAARAAGSPTRLAQELRAEAEAATAAEHAEDLAALKARHAEDLAALTARIHREQAERLRTRLLQLAGYAPETTDADATGGGGPTS